MKSKLTKYTNLIKSLIISLLLVEAIIYLFNFKNDYLVFIGTVILTFLIEQFRNIKKDKKSTIVISIYTLMISIVLLFQSKIIFTQNIFSNYNENTISNFEFIDILRVAIVFIPLFILFYYLYSQFKNSNYSILNKEKELTKSEKIKYWLTVSLIIFIPFAIYAIINYPGFFTPDSIRSIYESTNRTVLSNHHPVLYTLLVGFIMKVGCFIHSYNLGVFLYSIFQSMCLSLVFGYFALWLKNYKVKPLIIMLTVMFYISNTLFASQAITLWKDPLFSAVVFLLVLYLYDVIEKNGDNLKKPLGIALYILLIFALSFLRNNGIYISVAMFVILLFVYKKKLINFHISCLISIIIFLLIQGPLYSSLNIYTPKEENYGVPLQQIARTIVSEGKINKEQEEFLSQILPMNKWKEKYTPLSVDPIKWDEEFNKEFLKDNQGKLLKTWFEILPGNFDNYVKAYLLQTYGFWSIGVQHEYGLTGYGTTGNYMNLRRVDVIKNITGLSLEKYLPRPTFLGSGTLLWITLLSGALLILMKKSKYIICLLPLILGVGTILLATPVAFCLRYVLFLAFALPFIIILPFMERNKSNT